MSQTFFPYSILLGGGWPRRIGLIETVSPLLGHSTHFVLLNDGVLRESVKLDKSHVHLSRRILHSKLFNELAVQVDISHQHGLVHGDLHPKNIRTDGTKVVILDWEPSVQQIVHGMARLKGTFPYIHPEDLDRRDLSRKTDYLCLVRMWTGLPFQGCLSILEQWQATSMNGSAESLADRLELSHPIDSPRSSTLMLSRQGPVDIS
jgi:hypothetical protein